ncbi:MAG: polyprenyl synthetase family protein, partial [Candidatus Omnitrophota bacterium]
MDLKQIYRPIEKDFKKLEMMLKATLRGRNSRVIFEINKFLLGSGGKKLRPAMVFLAAGAVARTAAARDPDQKLVDLAAAVELVHRASLIHDDVIDRAQLRHSQPTLNHRWGQDVAIAAGDYFYAEAFRLIAACGNFKVIDCMGAATKLMCEGELNQICERGNVGLRKRQYLGMVQKKTAALFSASCEAGAVLAGADVRHQKALKDYGFNFGIAFQVRDDYLDLVGEE